MSPRAEGLTEVAMFSRRRRGVLRRLVASSLPISVLFVFTWSGPAFADTNPLIFGSPQMNSVQAHGFTPGAALTFVIKDQPGGTVLVNVQRTADGGGNASINPWDTNNQDLVPGMEVEVSSSADATRTLTLVPLSFTGIVPESDDVTGTAAGASTVDVNVFEWPGGSSPGASLSGVPVDGSGNWTADFSPSGFDIDKRTHAHAQINEPDGDGTMADLGPPNISAGLTCNCMWANGFTPNSGISFEIRNAPGGNVVASGAKQADEGGNASFNSGEFDNVDLKAGMNVQATDGVFTKGLTLVPLSITHIDVDGDDVSGAAPADASVWVNVGDPSGGWGSQTTAGPDGAWSVDFTGHFNITYMTGANARVEDLDGDATTVDRSPPRIEGHLHGQIGLSGFSGDVTLTIRSAPGVDPPLYTGAIQTNEGNAWVDRSQFNDVDLTAGKEIEASDGVVTKTLVLDDLKITLIDPGTDVVAGTGPAGAWIQVNVGDQGGGSGTTVQIDETGHWSFDFTALFDFGPTAGAQARSTDPDGDQTVVNRGIPTIHVSHDWCNCITGNNFEPNTTVTIDVFQSGPPGASNLWHGTTPTDAWGNFWIDQWTTQLDLEPGMYVEVTDGSTTKALTVENLLFTEVNRTTEVVAGTAPGPVGRIVDVWVGDGPENAHLQTTLGGDLIWSVDFDNIGFDFKPTMGVSAQIYDADQDTTQVDQGPEACAQTGPWQCAVEASLTGDWINLNGFTANSTVTLEIRDGATTLFGPQGYQTGVGGEFWLDQQDHGIDLQPGMLVRATDEATGTLKELTLADLTIDTVDTTADTVSGTAPAGQVMVGTEDANVEATRDGSSWTADFSGIPLELRPDMWFWANHFDADGDSTQVDKAPTLIEGHLTWSGISGEGFAPGSVQVEVYSSEGGTLLKSWTADADGGGNFWTDFWTDTGQGLAPGMFIKVTQGSTVKDLTLRPLTLDSVNLASDEVSGTATSGQTVGVNVWKWNDGDATLETTVTGGLWSVDFTGVPFDIDSATSTRAYISDDEGDRTVAERDAPSIEGSLTGDGISGENFTFNDPSVSVEIWDGPPGTAGRTRLWNGTTQTYDWGGFWIDYGVHGVDLTAGMSIEVDDGTYSRQLTLVLVTIDEVTVATDVISGTAPAGSNLEIQLREENGEEYWTGLTADGSGNWSVDVTGVFDVTLTTDVEVRVYDQDGDRTVEVAYQYHPRIEVNPETDVLNPQGFPPGWTLNYEIYSSRGRLLKSGTAASDTDGNATITKADHGIDLKAGIRVVVSAAVEQGTYTEELVISPLVIKSIDIATNVVTGTTNPGGEVVLCVEPCGGPGEGDGRMTVIADSRGRWTVDFDDANPPSDIVVGSLVTARQFDGEWDATVAEKMATAGKPRGGAATSSADATQTVEPSASPTPTPTVEQSPSPSPSPTATPSEDTTPAAPGSGQTNGHQDSSPAAGGNSGEAPGRGPPTSR